MSVGLSPLGNAIVVGYIDDPEDGVWGQIVGAREERQLLTEMNRIYMILRPGVDVKVGQQLTIF